MPSVWLLRLTTKKQKDEPRLMIIPGVSEHVPFMRTHIHAFTQGQHSSPSHCRCRHLEMTKAVGLLERTNPVRRVTCLFFMLRKRPRAISTCLLMAGNSEKK